ncbi:DUF862-domain-containing protein [Xylariaceae sp. FL0016]|nr:DUF862-domain-containing protein [Xylariaceae sp. FL0016]
MDVYLLVYDLSGGLAKQMSMSFLGVQLDAIYHTSIQLQNIEYVYDGGISRIKPGTSHLGEPLERIHLGRSEVPMEVLHDFLEELKTIYTPEAYDLFRHNCNNFSNDLSELLLGKSIPDRIKNMPQEVLDSPGGKSLVPLLTRMVDQKKAQQGSLLGIQQQAQPQINGADPSSGPKSTAVTNVFSLSDLNRELDGAKAAIVFFTSATCPPCKMLYPVYDELAAQHGDKVNLIKVDTSQAFDVAQRYSIRATPTFMTFVNGKQGEQWSGADAARLRGTVSLLTQMAVPSHPHQMLKIPHVSNPEARPVLFTKTPPLAKLLAKLGDMAEDPSVKGVRSFIETRTSEGPAGATLPDLARFSELLSSAAENPPKDSLFPLVDLFRCGLIDVRLSSYFAAESDYKTILAILRAVNEHAPESYQSRLVTLQMACNLFSSPLFTSQILTQAALRTPIAKLISSSFLDKSHNNVRVAAASLLYNVACANNHKRAESGDVIPEEHQRELAKSVLEAIEREEASNEALHGMLLALGFLTYCVPMEGGLIDYLRTADAHGIVMAKQKQFPNEPLVNEIGKELLGRGLARK